MSETTTLAEPGAKRPAMPWTPVQIWVLALLILVNVSAYLDRGVLSILQEPLRREMRLSDVQLAILGGPAFALCYSVAGIPIARLAERVNRARLLSVAASLWALMTVLCGAAQSYWQLALCRVGVGAAEGAVHPTCHSLLSEYFQPRQRGMAMAVLTTSIPLSFILAPLIGGVLGQTLGWRAALIIIGAPGLLVALLVRLTLKDPRPASTVAEQRAAGRLRFIPDLKVLLRTRGFILLFVSNIFLGQAMGATNIFTASYFVRQYGLSLSQAGAIMAAGLGLAGLAGTFAGGYLADRFAGKHGKSYAYVPALGCGLAAVFFLVTYTSATWGLALVFLIMANFSTDLKNGPIYAAMHNIAPPHLRATAAALLMLAVNVLGTAVGPMIVGVVSDLVASQSYAAGDFAQVCRGQALKDIPACAAASAAGLRSGLIVICGVFVLAMGLFLLAARQIQMVQED